MPDLLLYLIAPFLLAIFLAVNMGGSGTSPSFAAAYGANAIRRKWIPFLFGIMVLAGALIAGREVSLTLAKDLLNPVFFTPFNTSVILLSVGLSLLMANLLGVPQSTSQSTVLSISGAATALDSLNMKKLMLEIIPTWFLLPVIAFGIMLLLSRYLVPFIQRKISHANAARWQQHAFLRYALILGSLFVAFSIGANNVANAASPLASLTTNELGTSAAGQFLPVFLLSVLTVAPCFAIGSALLGHKVTRSTGKEIVEVSPFYATLIALLVATLLLLTSVTQGIPTSLVQLNGAAFIALSISKQGWKHTFHNKTVRRFFSVWMVAPMLAFALSWALIRLLGFPA
jgi:phosphate/sulfate permease